MLTGKAKQLFEEWYVSIEMNTFSPKYVQMVSEFNGGFVYGKLRVFYELPISMQFGVYQQWADSMGYYISITWIGNGVVYFSADITIDELIEWEEEFNTREEAQIAAIEKLNKIINER